MDDNTKTVLAIGIPAGLALLAGAIYFATRPAPEACQEGAVLIETCPDGTQVITHECINGVWVETGLTCADPGCIEGTSMLEACPDGSHIVTHQCINKVWEPTGMTCEDIPPDECAPDSVPYTYRCDDGTIRGLRVCVGGRWVPGRMTCPGYPPFPPTPIIPCQGGHADYCCSDSSNFNRQYECEYERWFPLHAQPCKTHPYGTCNQGTPDYMHLYFRRMYTGVYCIKVRWWDIIDNRVNTLAGDICSQTELMNLLNIWIAQGRITQLQHSNAVTQFSYMWPHRPPRDL